MNKALLFLILLLVQEILLYTVMNTIEKDVTATAVEIDELLVRLSAVTAELLEHPVTFFVQDALAAVACRSSRHYYK